MGRNSKIFILLSITLLICGLAYADYGGNTLVIPCNQGGLNHSLNVDALPNTAMIGTTRNINLHNDGREKRGGTTVDDATISSSQIMGIYKYRLKSGATNFIVADRDGKVYEDGNVLTTGMSVGNYYDFETYNDKLFIVDGASIPHVWDGSATETSQINSPHVNWTENAPFQVITHRRGNSERVLMLNTDAVYFSSDTSEEDFFEAAAHKIAIDTGDGYGLQGMIDFGDRVIVYGKTTAYRLDDSSSDKDNWGFYRVQWQGGVTNWRCIVETDNNIVLMADDGTVYDVRTVEQYGDYTKSSLTRPANIDKWIKDNVNLGQANNFHGVYDPNLRAVKFFVWRKSGIEVDTALVFFIDRGAENGWMIHGNWSNDSGYSASYSAVIEDNTGDYNTYTGDYGGNLWKLEQDTLHDNGKGFYAGFSGVLHFDDVRRHKQVDNIWIAAKEEGDYVVSIDTRYDNYPRTSAAFSMLDNNSTALIIGSATRGIIGTNTVGGIYAPMSSMISVEAGDNGLRMFYDIFTNSTTVDFFIREVMIDFKPLDRRF